MTVVNALSVDVEDYFQVSAFNDVVPYAAWDQFERRVEANTMRLLDLFDRHEVKATFFVLGWIADRHPKLVQELHLRGHEVGSHGYAHRTLDGYSPAEFRDEIRRAKAVLEDLTQQPVWGYRAPSFSVTARTLWALDVLADEGFRYDSSIFPIRHDRYGMPDAPRFPYVVRAGERDLHEFPMSTVSPGGLINIPVAGGGYLRWFPLGVTRWAIRHLNRREGRPAMLYVHPWEIDPEQPRIPARIRSRLRHYRNLAATESRLDALLREFRWGTIRSVLKLGGGTHRIGAAPDGAEVEPGIRNQE